MSIAPGKGRSSSSALPAPGRTSGLPTPGRPRSASSIHSNSAAGSGAEDEYISRAFADAIKANDPANHRPSYELSFPPSSPQFPSHSGRRSVAGRPSSVASSSSIASVSAQRHAKPFPRPASRTSDVFTRSSSRAGKPFDIGDNVRVESLGFEGILRYMGGIDGKAGTFAGVELTGGFAGKGKNDGSVNGKRYFSCPSGCGIFILSTKLSAPTVGYSSYSRPSSAASARNGRSTPSFSSSTTNGRKTPSISLGSGRVTPALPSGRLTPSVASNRNTPAAIVPHTRTRTVTVTKNNVTPTKVKSPESFITPGSRASKYVGMTAKQLTNSSSRTGAASPSRKSIGSPTAFGLSSPPHSTASLTSPSRARTISGPFTPRAGRTQGVGAPVGTPTRPRNGPVTPRARLPSSVSMPPPPSPSNSLTSRAVSLNDPTLKSDVDLAASGKAIQDMIGNLMSTRSPSSRPPSSASINSSLFTEQQLHLQNERLQARFDALEDENKRIRASLNVAESSVATMTTRLALVSEADEKSVSRISELESLLRVAERSVGERDSTIEGLERSAKEAIADSEKVKADEDARVRDIQSKLDDKEQLIAQLKELIETKEGLQSENDAVLAAKNAEIALLENRVQKAYVELEEERRDLGGQVDELRKAGQETIALYEERLSAADARRYELEDHVASLEEQLRVQARPVSPATVARQAVSAVEIDNEALKEQIQHLQKKLASLEDALEDAQIAAEKEELAVRERTLRYKEREDAVRKELSGCQQEVERISKLEENARMRVEEIEEALRENTVALENARAEIEGLRTEVANLEGIAADADNQPKAATHNAVTHTGDYEILKAEKQDIERAHAEQNAELERLRETCAALRQTLDELSSELEATRKKANREVALNGHQDPSSPTHTPSKELTALKDDLKGYKEEIKGHKHIIQELQKELGKENQRNKVLESENKLLVTEIAQLREDMKKLEDTFEQTLVREEQELATDTGSETEADNVTLQKSLKDLKAKYETEIDQLRRSMSETEMKNARTVHDLNKEIGELENLIETKIYREDELESEIDRLKERLAKSQKKSSKTGLPEDSRLYLSSTSTSSSQTSTQPFPTRAQKFSDSDKTDSVSGEEVCEICERPGHDIFTCDLLKDEQPLGTTGLNSMRALSASEDLFCEDCEQRGHSAANCPHSMDVF